jgi:hypothetical protein
VANVAVKDLDVAGTNKATAVTWTVDNVVARTMA